MTSFGPIPEEDRIVRSVSVLNSDPESLIVPSRVVAFEAGETEPLEQSADTINGL